MAARRFCLGDVHGRMKALKQVFERANFNDEDFLISIGDIVDRGNEPFECVEFLTKIPNKILIAGNHDYNFLSFIQTGHDGFQNHNGVDVTKTKWRELPQESILPVTRFFESQEYYYILENKCFVHGGFDRDFALSNQSPLQFIWDRTLWESAMSCKGDQKLKTVDKFDEIFIGHTPTTAYYRLDKSVGIKVPVTVPMYGGGVWNVDTGAGFSDGKLTLMNIDTKEYYQSDLISTLYE